MTLTALRITALTLEITQAATRVQLFPAGQFRAVDGRPGDVPFWFLDAALAQALIDAANARQTPYNFDYEHQTLYSQTNGQPAPAAGWFSQLEWEDGVGLFAVNVEWTDKARQMIEAKEYRFVSPMFAYDDEGNVRRLVNAAITNMPGLDGMDDLLAAACQLLHIEDKPMDKELLAMLCAVLGLSASSTEADLRLKLTELQDTTLKPAACTSVVALLTQQQTRIDELAAQKPDPAKYVPISVLESVQTQVAALNAKITDGEVDGLVTAALGDGRLLSDMADWARDLGKKDLVALKDYLAKSRPIAALNAMQTGGKPPLDADGRAVMSDNALAICGMFGTDTKDIATQLAQEEQRT